MEHDPERLARGLLPSEHAHRPLAPARGQRLAAVAMVLRFDRDGPEVLLMRRAVRDGDRWSGQISLPGGHCDPTDVSPAATAVREASEEVGLDLERSARVLGVLPPVQAKARGRILPLFITPIVFQRVAPQEPVLGDEAEEAFWFPLARAASGALRAVHRYTKGELVYALPAWNYEGRKVWGLTYEMLSKLIEPSR